MSKEDVINILKEHEGIFLSRDKIVFLTKLHYISVNNNLKRLRSIKEIETALLLNKGANKPMFIYRWKEKKK